MRTKQRAEKYLLTMAKRSRVKKTRIARAYVVRGEFEGYSIAFTNDLKSCTENETVIFRKVPKSLAPRIEAAIDAITGEL